MTLILVCYLIYHAGLAWWFYPIAIGAYVVDLTLHNDRELRNDLAKSLATAHHAVIKDIENVRATVWAASSRESAVELGKQTEKLRAQISELEQEITRLRHTYSVSFRR